MTDSASIGHNGNWRFLPEGALFHAREKVAVISDLHLGYTLARAGLGDFLPIDSGASIRTRLAALFERSGCKTLIVAGDVVESPVVSRKDPMMIDRFSEWIRSRGVEPVYLRGNHDGRCLGNAASCFGLDGWLVRHGHDEPSASQSRIREITGHSHPVLRWQGRTWRVFLSLPDKIVIPAFSLDAAGADVLDPKYFAHEDWGDAECLVCRSDDVVSFGFLRTLRVSVATMNENMRGRRFRGLRQTPRRSIERS